MSNESSQDGRVGYLMMKSWDSRERDSLGASLLQLSRHFHAASSSWDLVFAFCRALTRTLPSGGSNVSPGLADDPRTC